MISFNIFGDLIKNFGFWKPNVRVYLKLQVYLKYGVIPDIPALFDPKMPLLAICPLKSGHYQHVSINITAMFLTICPLNNGKDSDSKISRTRTARPAQHEGGIRDKQTDTRAGRTDKHKHQAHDRQPFDQTQSNNLSRNKQRKTPLTNKQFNNPHTRWQNKQAKKKNILPREKSLFRKCIRLTW